MKKKNSFAISNIQIVLDNMLRAHVNRIWHPRCFELLLDKLIKKALAKIRLEGTCVTLHSTFETYEEWADVSSRNICRY